VMAGLPDGPSRQQLELDLRATLGSALTATEGWSGEEKVKTLARARALAEQLDRPEYLVPLIVGQWGVHCARAEYRLTVPLGEQLEQIGEARNDVTAQLLGRFLRGITGFLLGDLAAARALLERSMGLADPAHRTIGGGGLSFDPYPVMLTYLALTLACLGHLDQAGLHMTEALSEGRRLGHAHTLTFVLSHATWLTDLTRSPKIHTDEVLTLATEHGFPHYLAWGLAHRGRELIADGQTQEGLALLRKALAQFRSIGSVLSLPNVLIWLAEAYGRAGQPAEERNYLAEAARLVETTEERAFEAELLHRIPGDLLIATGDRAGAAWHYRQAIAVAERQGAKLFQLRASTSLARLWRDRGKRMEARDLLAPIYNWFTEGFDAPDLKDAKALLDELA
jgi:tetratricopeptide (TPR) repeat protein